MQLRVEPLPLAVGLDVAGGDLALAAGLNIDRLYALGVELCDDALYIEDDLGHVLLYAGDGGELMLHACDLDGRDRRTGQGREQDAAQGITQRGAVTALQGLHHILAVGTVAGVLHTFNAGLLDFYHVLPSFSRLRAQGPQPYTAHQ